ncbi:MAG: SUMF1/EgtB/PvdO family nonheme iron enzyme [Verrucomicrobiales bacterium]|nr:SUMF1/EgtB/PvdO family nonheme iron enzyme [Verrucomicrobiales bacterium]
MKELFVTAVVALIHFSLSFAVFSAERVAFICGNDKYPTTPLDNAVRDATAIRDMVRDQLGFEDGAIQFVTNADRITFYECFEKFINSADGAEIVLFYYAGHGMESIDGRENFILPVDADVKRASQSEAALRATGINLLTLCSDLSRKTDGAKVVLMDACRQRPAGRSVNGRSGGGLAIYDDKRIPADTLIILAAAPDRLASDGEEHGPFSQALLEVLPRGEQDLMSAFFSVSDRVQEITEKGQIPWLKFDGSGKVFRSHYFLSKGSPASLFVPLKTTKRPSRKHSDPMEGKYAGEERDFGGIKFVWCPPGLSRLGSPSDEEGRQDDEGQYELLVPHGFWMAKYELHQGWWKYLMEGNPSRFEGDKLPVEGISWDEALEFSGKLNKRLRLKGGWKLDLPTEAQWEYVCRAGSEAPYHFGEDDSNVDRHAWTLENSEKKTHPVGGKNPNRWGLHDMTGNVWEYCHKKDAENRNEWAFRGGSWAFDSERCRSANRGLPPDDAVSDDRGFRVVIVPPEKTVVGRWTPDYDAALTLAKKEDLPLLLSFSHSCINCYSANKSVIDHPAWKAFAGENLVLVNLEFASNEKNHSKKLLDRNGLLLTKFGVKAFPTFLVVENDGEKVLGQLSPKKDNPLESINTIKFFSRMSKSGQEEFARANPEKASVLRAAIAEFAAVKKELRDWIATNPQRNDANDKIYEDFKKRFEDDRNAVRELFE